MGLIESLQQKITYFDTSIFVYSVENNQEFGAICHELMQGIETSQLSAITSELTLSETLVFPFRNAHLETQRKYQEIIETSGGLLVVPVIRHILIQAAELRAATPSLKTPDAIHLATALETGCEVFLTNDSRIKSPELEIVTLSSLIVKL
jgi:predicted nucleic acid-binding protein